ncbi:MAG: radical SAM protein [Candidatus Woesearchaeota archaeon]
MLKYEDLTFIQEKDKVIVKLYKYFHKEFSTKEILEELGPYEIKDGKIVLSKYPDERAEKKIMRLIRKYKKDLTYSLNGNKAIFVDEDLGLPMMGLNFLGILDKGSEMLEIKPITNCNADCVFCSVDEGPSSKKSVDFIVDVNYLVDEINKLLHFKDTPGISIWINPHGEPTLYSKLAELCDLTLRINYVKDITIITNGLLLNKALVDKLHQIKTSHSKPIKLSVSISGVSKEMSKKMMGESYNINIVKKNLEYAIEKLEISITPVLLSWMNTDEMIKIIELAQELSKNKDKEELRVAIQKFCKNKKGRNPGKEQSWEDFFKELRQIEAKTNYKLLHNFGKIKETPELPTVCKKDEKISVKILCYGRYKHNRLGIFETPLGNRAVAVIGCNPEKGIVKTKVIQSKHNMIVAKC